MPQIELVSSNFVPMDIGTSPDRVSVVGGREIPGKQTSTCSYYASVLL